MSLILGKAIYNILTSDSGVTNYINNKIYPIYAEDDTLKPYVTYRRTSVNVFYTKDGHAYDEVAFEVDIIDDDYSDNVEIANAVRNALEDKQGTYSDVKIIDSSLDNATEDWGIDGYITTLNFTFKCK